MARPLLIAALALAGCTATIPDGQLLCSVAAPDCPDDFVCCPATPSGGFDGVCSRSACGDAGTGDAGPRDAGADAGADAATDAGADAASPRDAGACDESAVRFVYLASGPLAVGTLCDDVFVCVTDAAEEARVVAASSRFACMPTPEGPCSGMTCAYRDPGGPSTLDAAELAEICAVTLVSPTPDVACAVYGP